MRISRNPTSISLIDRTLETFSARIFELVLCMWWTYAAALTPTINNNPLTATMGAVNRAQAVTHAALPGSDR